jgi:hypothetical protein
MASAWSPYRFVQKPSAGYVRIVGLPTSVNRDRCRKGRDPPVGD